MELYSDHRHYHPNILLARNWCCLLFHNTKLLHQILFQILEIQDFIESILIVKRTFVFRPQSFENNINIIIIIFYFENVAFFHVKLGSDVCLNYINMIVLKL